jgi:hypothetical protein
MDVSALLVASGADLQQSASKDLISGGAPMNRRYGIPLTAVVIMLVVAALASQQRQGLLLLEWAGKAAGETPSRAILIEMGLKDAKPASWSGRTTVVGAKVVHREGYRFRTGDKLIEPDAWEASSHRPIRVPKGQPAILKVMGLDHVGVVLHLADIQADAKLTVHSQDPERKAAQVSLKEVLAGESQKIWGGSAVVRLISTATPVVTAKTEDDFPAAAYGPDGTLWVAYISYTVKEEGRRIEAPSLKEQPANFKAYYTPEFGDQLFVKYFKAGKWSEPIAITGSHEDLIRCAVAVEGNGDAWVIYSAQRNGKHRLYARSVSTKHSKNAAQPKPSPEQLLTAQEGTRDVNPVACTGQNGDVWVYYQSWTKSGPRISCRTCTNGKWEDTAALGGGDFSAGSGWQAGLAAGPGGVAMAYDLYNQGDYDVFYTRFRTTLDIPVGVEVAASAKFEARPSVAVDVKDRLWIAYEQGPEKWGKNFGALDDEDGNPLYFARTIRVVCLEKDKLFQPVAELPPLNPHVKSPDTGLKAEGLPCYAYPKIGIDGKGRVWLTYREKFGTRYSTHGGPYWLTFARRLDGDRWTEPIEIHHSDGLLDDRPVLLPHPAGGLRVLHTTDGRYTTPETLHNQIYMSYVDLPGEPVEPKLVSFTQEKKPANLVAHAKKELDAVERIKKYRVECGGKKYQLLRGEFHRHTEISWDGAPDGSLEDMFRYAIDAAGMDWIGNGDHDNGGGREYTWWLTQKFTDAYHVPGRFTPMFSYERSVSYPHGHRNCIFARRGVRTLPRLAEPDPKKRVGGVHADDTKMLYRYLKELDGLCASHTSATGMGTDWRDNDPVVEPIVEIYQGDRMSYEMEGAPRAGYDPKTGKLPANIAGWYPKGFVNLALQKGHRLGFQSSSDHMSTHISYCIVLAERHDREAILDGLKKRHCYGATDDIILDVKSGNHVMGDEFKTTASPALDIRVIGTAPLAKVEILKDSQVVQTFQPGKDEFKSRWSDPNPAAGVHYYYVRVQQANGELAWGSPMWIEKGQ